eukprot:g15972.t1
MADVRDQLSTEDVADSVDVLFLLMCSFFMLLMQPGFALYEAGTIDRTAPQVILIKNIVDAAIALAMWFAVGNMFAGRGDNGFIGTKAGVWFTGEQFDEDDSSLPHVRFLYSGLLAATSVTIMSGSVADRVPYKLYLIYAVTTCAFTYPLVAHWAWSEDGWASSQVGRFNGCGVLDFAGSGVVHAFAGMSTLVFAKMLPTRKDRFKYARDEDANNPSARRGPITRVQYREGFTRQNRTNQALGMFLLWFGWYGFNCGSARSISSTTSRQIVGVVAVNTTISPVVCCLASMAIEKVYHMDFHSIKETCFPKVYDKNNPGAFDNERIDLHSAAINGVLCGLVSVTAGCATTDPRITIIVATGAAFIYHLSYRVQLELGLDDAVNGVPIHLYCGVYGLFLAGCTFSDELHNDYLSSLGIERGSCDVNSQMTANVVFLIVLVLWSGLVSYVLFKGLDKLVDGSLAAPNEEPTTPEIDDLWLHQNDMARNANRRRRQGRPTEAPSPRGRAAESKSSEGGERKSQG